MNIKNSFKNIIRCSTVACIAFVSCTQPAVITKGEISSLQADTTITLKAGQQDSPNCHVVIDFMYLRPSSELDTLSQQINQTLQRITFGTNYLNMSPEEAIVQIQSQYGNTYREALSSYYDSDIKNGMSKDEMPPWYNHEHSITSELTLARDSIYNYAVTNYEFTGGAHPNTYITWKNINSHTGKELKKSDVFTDGSDKEVLRLIGQHLLKDVNQRLETDTITSVQSLRDEGVLFNVDLYIPDNFLITDEGVKFLYNRYEIAPYYMGDFQLNIPYAEIENLMKIK